MNTPIVDFVKKYADSNSLRLHMPGHKGKGTLGFEKYDITEIDGADVLYSADGIIAESQNNAAKLFDTKGTFYSTEGSSLCIRAMLYLVKLYAMQKQQTPFVAATRNAHKTFVTAAALLNVDVEWLLPQNTQTIVSCVITAEYLDNYLKNARQKPVAVYITSPDYLGNITDIKSISSVCKKHGVLLLVDNAHGAYLKFLKSNIHPINLGADMCCDSAHKTLPVLTGGAYLHIGKSSDDFFAKNAMYALSVFASTSPSYLVLQSLDAANKYISDGYTKKLDAFVKKIEQLKQQLKNAGYVICENEPLKLTVLTKPYGYHGHEFAKLLLKSNVTCEFYDLDYVVFMFTPELETDGINKLREALLKISKQDPIDTKAPAPLVNETKLTLAQALYAPYEEVDIQNSIGRVFCSGDVSCPPAIPIVLPGEIINESAIECMKYYGIKKCNVVK